jgi:hypothetical protein
MTTTALLQAAVPAQSWVGPVAAISLAVIALSFLAIGIAVAVLAGKIGKQVKTVGATVAGLQDDVARVLGSVRRLTEQAQDLMVVVRNEAGAFAQTSRRVRRKIVKGVDRVQERLEDLEALYDVVHDEVEDTALDVAAGLRTIRSGNGMIGRVRRMIVASR